MVERRARIRMGMKMRMTRFFLVGTIFLDGPRKVRLQNSIFASGQRTSYRFIFF